jgi:tetratricopeptide (TPR) repeat protein
VLAVAEPRWQALQGVKGAERALIRMAGPLANAHFELHSGIEVAARYVQQRTLLAEAYGDADMLANALIQLGSVYQATGAPVTSRAVTEAAAGVARAHDLPGTLANALTNLGTIQMSRDIDAALATFKESLETARRSGIAAQMDYGAGNYASALWTAGRLAEARALIDEARETVTIPTISLYLACIDAWVGDARGEPLGELPQTEASLSSYDHAAVGSIELMRLLAAGDTTAAAASTEATLAHVLTTAGLDDDFMHFWPPLVRAALADHDVPLAERLITPVQTASPGIVSPAVAAHLLNLRGLVRAARGDEPAEVESDLRSGVKALTAFGALGWASRAEDDLGRWLVGQGRMDEAAPVFAHVRETYEAIGAAGWLARLDAWLAEQSHVPAR